MKFNRLIVYITIILMISNIISKRLRNKKKSKSQDDDIPDLMLVEKNSQIKDNIDRDNFDDNEENTLNSNEEEYREDVLFETEEKQYDNEMEDEDGKEAEKIEKLESDIDTALLETKSRTKNKSNADFKNHVANRLNKNVSKNKKMIGGGK